MAPDEPTETHELRREQRERETQEGRLEREAELPEEVEQHGRRREKAAYLEEKLAEREAAERERE